MSQQFCLKWNNHMNNMMDVFKNLLSTEAMVDVTLACDGLSLKAHKIVLSACSPFFQSLFLENPCKHPIVILKDMKYTELKAIIEFMYHGEVNVAQDQLSALMKTAETLRVKGLAEVTNEKNQSGDESSHRSVSRTDTPPPKRRRGRTRKRSLSDQSDASDPKIKQPDSDIEELSGDMDPSTPYSTASTVPLQSHSTNSFHKSQQEQPVEQGADESFAPEEKFGVEPSKLLEQTLTTDDLPRRSGRSSVQSNMELQRRPRSSTDHSTSLVPVTSTPMSSDALANQQPESPPDIKPELLDLEPPMSPVAGPSHSTDENSMMMYMDQSSMSTMPGPSGYQDNSALVSTDSQPQASKYIKVWSGCGKKKAVTAGNLEELKAKGITKLGLRCGVADIRVHLEDGTEIDQDDVFITLPDGTVLIFNEVGENPYYTNVGPPENMETDTFTLPDCVMTFNENVSTEFDAGKIKPDIKKPWPKDFKISFHRCSPELVSKMRKGIASLNWQAKHELLNIIADDISQFTLHPDIVQRKQVAANLIENFPSLKPDVDDGLSGWAERIYAKMKDLRSKQETEESKAVRRNRRNISTCVKVPHRGESNFLPTSVLPSEEEFSMVTWMKGESLKPKCDQDRQKIENCLAATFPSRRKTLATNSLSLLDIKENYPLLFTSEGLIAEFKHLQGIDIGELIQNLKYSAHKIILEATKKLQKPVDSEAAMTPLRLKRIKALELKEQILNHFNSVDVNDIEHRLLCAFLLLPVVLLEEASDIYKIIEKGCRNDIPGDTSAPIIIFIGNPFVTKEFYICGENEILVNDLRDTKTAIAVLFCLYYVCNIEYPASCKCSFLFLQNYLLKLHHGRRLPPKLINLIEKL